MKEYVRVCTQCGVTYWYQEADPKPQVCPHCAYDDPFFDEDNQTESTTNIVAQAKEDARKNRVGLSAIYVEALDEFWYKIDWGDDDDDDESEDE